MREKTWLTCSGAHHSIESERAKEEKNIISVDSQCMHIQLHKVIFNEIYVYVGSCQSNNAHIVEQSYNYTIPEMIEIWCVLVRYTTTKLAVLAERLLRGYAFRSETED